MPLLRRRDNTLARELSFPRLHTSKNACQVAFNVLREMQRSFAMLFVLRGMFPIVTWCMKKPFGKLPVLPAVRLQRAFFKSRTYFFTVWL